MKLRLTFFTIITSTAIAASIHLASLQNPTNIHKQIQLITDGISASVITGIFERLCKILEDDLDDQNSDQ